MNNKKRKEFSKGKKNFSQKRKPLADSPKVVFDGLVFKGRHEVLQALDSEQKLETVFLSASVKGPISSKIKEAAAHRNIPVKELNQDLFKKKFGDDSQGVLAVGGQYEYIAFEKLVEKANSGAGVIVALNKVEDPRNLGAIIRTVEASGCDGIIIPKHRAAGVNEWAIRTAQGAASLLPVARVTNLADSLEALKNEGYWAVGLDGAGDKVYSDVVYSGKIVLVAGGEDAGIGERVKKACDDVVNIPLNGKTTSLNVSVSTAIVLYEVLRQKDFLKKNKKSC
eukprot:Anaeramoba_ignava/a6715_11.p1 GENE.a6715_11~~a6715_11.p1  ORF type:complete len:281 (+),score=33.08 a6715_11:479-1321(+)